MMDDASRAQVSAADPGKSTWLSANAGSGKTRVLTDRVARLLLGGVPPQRILCLTYTKAAASEMQNRLFRRLGAWAMMSNADLAESLSGLGVPADILTSETLAEARRLFAKAIETPGGLKIQTIHSFCASLLRRFPLEAGVSPNFREMDDRTTKLARSEILDQMAEDCPDVFSAFAEHFRGDDTDKMLGEIAKNAAAFQSASLEALAKWFGLDPRADEAAVAKRAFIGGEDALVSDVVKELKNGKESDQALAAALSVLDLSVPDLEASQTLERLFLTAGGTPKKFQPTKDVKVALGPIAEAFDDFRNRIADARDDRFAARALRRTQILYAFAGVFLQRLAQYKLRTAQLDFDDLILKARALLTDPAVASWVLFKLDGGVDHILVDEAQDTSPAQWDVVQLLAQEFTSGVGAQSPQARTIFVVGDPKQSIYSFQGADPAAFDTMREYFNTALSDLGQDLQQQDLLYSFRSAEPVLQLVDATFTEDLRKGMGDQLLHHAFKSALPGRVDLWPVVEPEEAEPERDWFDPVDILGTDHHSVRLARNVARFIKEQLESGRITQLEEHGGETTKVTRPIRASDFLILVQGRGSSNGLFKELLRACKDADLPIAGADRLKVGAELGVKDLTALLSYLATPEDDLSLATVLRSPLCGLSEAELYDLAHGRPSYLRQSLEEHRERFPQVHAMLKDLRDQADFLRPYDLLERALTRHGGRERIVARLGAAAEEGIAALLDQAQRFEQASVPNLTSFLAWLAADELEIKRQLDGSNDEIRIMTVHGAKGLEAPIVILPETLTAAKPVRDEIFVIDGLPLWKPPSEQMPKCIQDVSDQIKTRQDEERMRLLYVAMTRAESWLVICGAGKVPKTARSTWYQILEDGMARAGATQPQEQEVALRLSHLSWPEPQRHQTVELVMAEKSALPDWAYASTIAPRPASKTYAPSDLGGAKVIFRDKTSEPNDGKERGTAVHLLLEHLAPLPDEQREDRGLAMLARMGPLAESGLLAEALAVLRAPELTDIFAPDTLAEVPVSASLPSLNGARIYGSIDRLIITEDGILAVDFKSNFVVPERAADTPDGLLRQMGAYAEALEQIYPGKKIATAILWTKTATLMTLPHDIVRSALRDAIYLDPSEGSSYVQTN
ncbi:double-strand break repair helicase AddA [Litoreibacter roseus]|uniref:DNA 3'-5' helicase n=1 Tax=Litoreibacter roseus TaxID=2601869 RepID=A0A6N6JEJ5_9RHOB|nr:double-strand break repair helicase AddA [Litoreibacter roseus]GFE64771.1 double-strand break repair helicase AddA [Litoreibacter roseus]